MPPVNPLTPTSSTYISRDSSNPEDQDIWFDAIDHVEMEETWFEGAEAFDTHEEHQADPLSSAGEAADYRVPFTEDCRRGVQQFVRTLGEYGESRMLSACLSKILPGTPTSLIIAANSLYTAVTERRNIDTAALHALGLASGYLPDNINIVSRLATFIRDTVTGWTDETFLQQFLGNEGNHTSVHLFTALAITAIVAGRWMKDEGAPQRGVLKVPAFMANIFIRASHYWTALGNMAGSLPSGAEIPENTGPSQRAPAFEVDTRMEMTGDVFDATAFGASAPPRLTAFSSNSTARPEAYTRATVQNRPAPAPGKNTRLSAPEQAHYLALEKLRQESGLSDLLYCATSKTESRQQTNEKIITNTYFNTKCEATVYPEPLTKGADSIPAHTDIPETQASSAATSRGGDNTLLPLVMTGAVVAPVATSYMQALKSKPVIAARVAAGLNDSSFLASTPAFVSDRDNGLSPPVSQNTAHSDNSGNGFSAMLRPVANALHEAGEFIARHDPLRFPGADAAALPSEGVNSITATDIAKDINESRYLSGDVGKKIIEIVSVIERREDLIAIKDVLNKLNSITTEAEDKYPSDTTVKNIDHLIYLIENSDGIISDFEIKYHQNSFCNQLKMQLENHIKTAVEITDKKDALKLKEYIGKIPSLKLTPDSRGEGYQPVERLVAGNLVRSVFWFQNDAGYSAGHGLRYEAHKAMLTYIIAEKGLGDLNKLPDNWYKGDEALRLFRILYRDLENNLKNKGKAYLIRSAQQFYSSLSGSYSEDSTLEIKGLEKKTLSSYSNEDKLLALRHYLNKPVDIDYHQETNKQRFLKIVDLVLAFQSILAVMRPKTFSERNHRHHHNGQRTVTSTIYGKLPGGKVRNFRLKINKKNNELVIAPTKGVGLKKQGRINRKNNEILLNHNKISGVKFTPNKGGRSKNSQPTVSKEVRNKIMPNMYAKNIDPKKLSAPNNMGLMRHENGKKYIKIDKSHVEVKEREGYLFIKKNGGGVINIEYRNNKIHLESHRQHLARIKYQGLSGRMTRPDQMIANRLKVSEVKAKEILSKYEFPEGSQLYTEGTFAMSVRDTGKFPEWSKSFKKIEANDYVSPYRESKVMDNGLHGFNGKSNYFYRVDNTPPETVLKNGFKASEDYTAISKMLPEDMDGVIVAESLEGARRYQTINKNSHIYRIDGKNVEGVSLKDNLYTNEKGLNDFLGEPLAKKHSTLESLAEDTNGAIYLDEVHLRKETIRPSAISIVHPNEISGDLSPGPWKKYL
ncbi:UNVERIFIED_ORG: hypothetical protein FHW05_004714 [Pantoea agglomerans]